jgi:hypothetical protein
MSSAARRLSPAGDAAARIERSGKTSREVIGAMIACGGCWECLRVDRDHYDYILLLGIYILSLVFTWAIRLATWVSYKHYLEIKHQPSKHQNNL